MKLSLNRSGVCNVCKAAIWIGIWAVLLAITVERSAVAEETSSRQLLFSTLKNSPATSDESRFSWSEGHLFNSDEAERLRKELFPSSGKCTSADALEPDIDFTPKMMKQGKFTVQVPKVFYDGAFTAAGQRERLSAFIVSPCGGDYRNGEIFTLVVQAEDGKILVNYPFPLSTTFGTVFGVGDVDKDGKSEVLIDASRNGPETEYWMFQIDNGSAKLAVDFGLCYAAPSGGADYGDEDVQTRAFVTYRPGAAPLFSVERHTRKITTGEVRVYVIERTDTGAVLSEGTNASIENEFGEPYVRLDWKEARAKALYQALKLEELPAVLFVGNIADDDVLKDFRMVLTPINEKVVSLNLRDVSPVALSEADSAAAAKWLEAHSDIWEEDWQVSTSELPTPEQVIATAIKEAEGKLTTGDLDDAWYSVGYAMRFAPDDSRLKNLNAKIDRAMAAEQKRLETEKREAAKEERRQQASEQQKLSRIKQYLQQCASAEKTFAAAVKAEQAAAASGRPQAVETAVNNKARAQEQYQEARQAIHDVVEIYQARGMGNAATAVRREAGDCY